MITEQFDRPILNLVTLSDQAAALLSSALLIALCLGVGLLLGLVTGQPWQVMLLSTAPGSVTEMALTAKIRNEGLATITAFHLVRIFTILPLAGTIIGLTARLAQRATMRTS